MSLITSKKLENTAEHLAGEHDYYSLLIKSIIYRYDDENDSEDIKKLAQDIQRAQSEDGSWEDTVLATTHQLEKLHNLGASLQDNSVQKALSFLFQHLNLKWQALQSSGKEYELRSRYVFSTEDRDLEFEAAKNTKKNLRLS